MEFFQVAQRVIKEIAEVGAKATALHDQVRELWGYVSGWSNYYI